MSMHLNADEWFGKQLRVYTEPGVPETIRWQMANEIQPDSGMLVLVFRPDAAGEPVWIGYLDEDGWRYVDASQIDEEVVAWAEIPAGPKLPAVSPRFDRMVGSVIRNANARSDFRDFDEVGNVE